MEVARRRKRVSQFPVSDEVVPLLESLTGVLTLIETKYGGVSSMVESVGWDEAKTDYSARLVKVLRGRVAKLETEFRTHVQNKRHANE